MWDEIKKLVVQARPNGDEESVNYEKLIGENAKLDAYECGDSKKDIWVFVENIKIYLPCVRHK